MKKRKSFNSLLEPCYYLKNDGRPLPMQFDVSFGGRYYDDPEPVNNTKAKKSRAQTQTKQKAGEKDPAKSQVTGKSEAAPAQRDQGKGKSGAQGQERAKTTKHQQSQHVKKNGKKHHQKGHNNDHGKHRDYKPYGGAQQRRGDDDTDEENIYHFVRDEADPKPR